MTLLEATRLSVFGTLYEFSKIGIAIWRISVCMCAYLSLL